jgi:uncharacterized membrane protein YgaE (UPF0421/DUF939 family)
MGRMRLPSSAFDARAVPSRLRSAFPVARLVFAAKTAFAAAIAWWLGGMLSEPFRDYAYYAAFGAVISMSATVIGTLRHGLQTLLGLGLGILLALAMIPLSAPAIVEIAIVVAIGVALGGIRRLGAGRDYVAVAALFVLVIGGTDPEPFSLSYLVQTGMGAVVGLLVNLLVLPPLSIDAAVTKMSGFRASLARYLDDMGAALTEDWPPAHEEWAASTAGLADTAADVRAAVQEAADSRRANPRARRHRRDAGRDERDLETMERVGFHVRNISDTLASAVWKSPFDVSLPNDALPPMSAALHAAADLVRAWKSGEAQEDRLQAARDTVDALFGRLSDERVANPDPDGTAASVALDLRRIVLSVQPRLAAIPAPPERGRAS